MTGRLPGPRNIRPTDGWGPVEATSERWGMGQNFALVAGATVIIGWELVEHLSGPDGGEVVAVSLKAPG
jgi:hypothetical protein